MFHRAIRDPVPPADTDADLAAVERGERHLRLLAEIAEIGMGLVRSLGELAQARVRRELNGEDGPARAEDAAAAFDKMSQTVRRTLALEARLAEGVTLRRQGLGAERAARRAAHKTAVDKAIVIGLHDAWAADCPDAEYHAMVDRLLEDAQEYLGDADEMRGYLDRPVGETVAKLCTAFGLDPEACELDAGAWRVRRPPLDFEMRIDEKARKYGASSPSLPRSGEGQDAKHPGWGTLSASAAPVITPYSPTLTASPSVPPHKGEGGREYGEASRVGNSLRDP